MHFGAKTLGRSENAPRLVNSVEVGLNYTQLRPILRVSGPHPVSILFPMVEGLGDNRPARTLPERAQNEFTELNLPFGSKIPMGAMIENPTAAIMMPKFATDFGFFSVRTNDLVQYLLTSDRMSSDVAP